jgi:hypothetical protein
MVFWCYLLFPKETGRALSLHKLIGTRPLVTPGPAKGLRPFMVIQTRAGGSPLGAGGAGEAGSQGR